MAAILGIPHQLGGLSNFSFQLNSLAKYNSSSTRFCSTRPPVSPSSLGDCGSGLRVFVISDLHTDYGENMKWIKNLSSSRYKNGILLVAGDVAETYHNFSLTMSLLKDIFYRVFFVPGNHDLWCRRERENYGDSLEKMSKLLDWCSQLGVETSPAIIDGLGIIPLFSWYHESFDREDDITDIRVPSLEMVNHLSFSLHVRIYMPANGLPNFQTEILLLRCTLMQ